MTALHTDAEFGTRLLTERAVQRVHAFHGDLVARMLLDEHDRDGALASRLSGEGTLYRCRDGSVALTDSTVLHDPRFTSTPTEPAQYTLDFVDDVIRAESDSMAPEFSAGQDEVDSVVSRVRKACPAPEFDLVAGLIRPVVAELFCATLGIEADRRKRFQELTARAGGALDAAVCPPRLTDAYALKNSLLELPDRCGAEAFAIAIFGTEIAVNLITNTARAMLGENAAEDPATLVGRVLFQNPPLRLHRLFTAEPVDLGGHRIEAGTRVLVLNDDARHERDGEQATALAVAAHPRPAGLAIAVAVAVSAALRGHLGGLRPAGDPAWRLRAPVTRAIVRLPVTATEVR
jgi:hypothetical protein